jgi:hypothetical protein
VDRLKAMLENLTCGDLELTTLGNTDSLSDSRVEAGEGDDTKAKGHHDLG